MLAPTGKRRFCGGEEIPYLRATPRRGSALEGTRLDAGATKTTLVAEIRSTRCFSGCSSGVRELYRVCQVQLAAHVQRQKEDDAMTGTAASRRSRIWSSRSSKAGSSSRAGLLSRVPAPGPA